MIRFTQSVIKKKEKKIDFLINSVDNSYIFGFDVLIPINMVYRCYKSPIFPCPVRNLLVLSIPVILQQLGVIIKFLIPHATEQL